MKKSIIFKVIVVIFASSIIFFIISNLGSNGQRKRQYDVEFCLQLSIEEIKDGFWEYFSKDFKMNKLEGLYKEDTNKCYVIFEYEERKRSDNELIISTGFIVTDLEKQLYLYHYLAVPHNDEASRLNDELNAVLEEEELQFRLSTSEIDSFVNNGYRFD